jgi:hypothetical protein
MSADTRVPAGPARIHVIGLIDSGMSQAAICRAAHVTSAYLSALLFGQYTPGRPPQKTMCAEVAARLLAVGYDGPAPKPIPTLCAPGDRFEALGYRVGRCEDCGQLAPVQMRDDRMIMFAHPRAENMAPGAVPAAAGHGHRDCGTPRGHQRHRRENTAYCEPCKAAKRGFEQGWDAGLAKAARMAPAVSAEKAEAVVTACRAYLHRRPVPQMRELALTVVQVADAELCVDAQGRAA